MGYTTTDDAIRKKTMSRIKGKGTSIEVALRKTLWHMGYRYRVNYRVLPGAPDIAILRHKIAIFCDGEFWHGKDWGQKKGRLKCNREYWVKKIERNIERDNAVNRELYGIGWAVLRFWGSDIIKNRDWCVSEIKDAIIRNKLDAYYDIDDFYG